MAGKDVDKYARSMTEDTKLFKDFYEKAWKLQKEEIQNIASPTPENLKELIKESKKLAEIPKPPRKA